jgi:ATP-dependent Clp protease protease subunit
MTELLNLWRSKLVQETGVDTLTRTLYLVGQVDDRMAARALVGIAILAESPDPITVVINSPGGSEPCGYAIFDRLVHLNVHVTAHVYGACQSIASVILQAAQVRLLAPEAVFMIHHGYVDVDGALTQDQVLNMAEAVNAGNARYHRILALRSGKSIKQVRAICLKDTDMSAKDAIRHGFADGLIKKKDRRQ